MYYIISIPDGGGSVTVDGVIRVSDVQACAVVVGPEEYKITDAVLTEGVTITIAE